MTNHFAGMAHTNYCGYFHAARHDSRMGSFTTQIRYESGKSMLFKTQHVMRSNIVGNDDGLNADITGWQKIGIV